MTRQHLVNPGDKLAYRVPWRFERHPLPGRFTLRNLGHESLEGVSLTLYGPGVMPATAPCTLHPGEALEIRISGRDLARRTIAVVHWFRPGGEDPGGEEYLWRVSF